MGAGDSIGGSQSPETAEIDLIMGDLYDLRGGQGDSVTWNPVTLSPEGVQVVLSGISQQLPELTRSPEGNGYRFTRT